MPPTWEELVADRRVQRHKTSRAEMVACRKAIRRDLHDADVAALSVDNRFALAYGAAVLHAKMAIACAGFRVRGEGSHETVFRALALAVGPSASRFAEYYESCRRKRNELTYERAGVVHQTELDEILERTRRLGELVETWIWNQHPQLS